METPLTLLRGEMYFDNKKQRQLLKAATTREAVPRESNILIYIPSKKHITGFCLLRGQPLSSSGDLKPRR